LRKVEAILQQREISAVLKEYLITTNTVLENVYPDTIGAPFF
jgi:hypothetical protein